MLAESEVTQLDVASIVDQNVVWFEVAMDVVHFVHGLDRQDLHYIGNYHLRYVESRLLLSEYILFDEERHEVPSLQELHHQVQVDLVLEGVLQTDNPRVAMDQHIPLGPDVRNLVLLEHLLLLEPLDGDDLVGFVLAAEPDLAEGPLADDGQRLEIVGCDFGAPN